MHVWVVRKAEYGESGGQSTLVGVAADYRSAYRMVSEAAETWLRQLDSDVVREHHHVTREGTVASFRFIVEGWHDDRELVATRMEVVS